MLLKSARRLADPGFIEAALHLSQIETQTGMGYHQVMSNFEKAQKQLPQLDKKLDGIKAELESVSAILEQRKEELTKIEKYLHTYQEEVKGKKAQLELELSNKMHQLGLKEVQMEEVAELKIKLAKQGLDLQTFLNLVKEFSHGNSKD
jgi:chromosome segregation ATPase